MEEQLFENTPPPTLRVGNKRTREYLLALALSVLFHLVIAIVCLVIAPIATEEPRSIVKPVIIFSTSTHLYNPKPTLPSLKQKLATEKSDKSFKKSPGLVPSIPVEAPNEVKPGSPGQPAEELPTNPNNNPKDVAPGGSDPGEKGGVPGGVPGGIPGIGSHEIIDGIVGQSPFTQERVVIKGSAKPPKRTRYVHPEYPSDAQRAGVEGTVVVEAIVGKDGKIKSARITKSVALLDSAALEAIKKWEYSPTIINGTASEVILVVTINFHLK